VLTPGGAGIGAPAKRDPKQVAEDVRDGMVSPEAASNDYHGPRQAAE
jgi:N-methylhydantoinase B